MGKTVPVGGRVAPMFFDLLTFGICFGFRASDFGFSYSFTACKISISTFTGVCVASMSLTISGP